MASLGFRERILEVAEDGAALANSTTATSILPAIRKVAALPVGYFDRIGKTLAFEFSGRIGTVATTPGTLTIALRFGSTDVFSTGAMALNTTAQTTEHWLLRGELVCRAIGASTSTTLFPKGCTFTSIAVIGSAAETAGGAGTFIVPILGAGAPAVGTGFDNSAVQAIDLYATWSIANASNSITLHCGSIDVYS